MKKKFSAVAALLVALLLSVSFYAVSAETGTGIELFTDKECTQAAGDSLTVYLGATRTDLYYRVNGATGTTVTAVAEDASVVQVFVISDRVGFVALAGDNHAGTTNVTISADGVEPLTISVTTDYALPGEIELETDGEKPGAINREEVGDSISIEFGNSYPVYATGKDASGKTGTLNPAIEYRWAFEENTCGAAFVPAQAAEEADIAGSITVTGVGSASASVTMYLNDEPVGTPKEFTVTSVYQQMGSDVDIKANDISITGIRYTAGSDEVSLIYKENDENLSESAALDSLKLDFTVSNKDYIDPTDFVWSSTDSSSVKVENGKLVFGENITGSKQVTITLTNKDKTAMDSFLVVISAASSQTGDGNGGGCSSSAVLSFGGLAAAAIALGVSLVLFKRAKRS